MLIYKFAAAWEHDAIVFGSARPRQSAKAIDGWIDYMRSQGIQRVCCLLPLSQLAGYPSNLIEVYRQQFSQVCWAPIEDFQLTNRETLVQQILPFLADADLRKEKTVVHCAGGVGRTGQVLSAWLVYRWGLSNREAIAAIKRTGRNPYEAAFMALLKGKSPWKAIKEFNLLLDGCRSAKC
jgi:Dual specificity phosphatase, catalytic domain